MYRHPEDGGVLPKHVAVSKELCCCVCQRCADVGCKKSNVAMPHGFTRDRLHLKCDGTRAETRFRLSAKSTSPFKSAGGFSSVDNWLPRCGDQR